MSDFRSIELVEKIAAPRYQVFAAFASAIALETWFSDFAEMSFNEKGHLYCWWNVGYYASGLYTNIVDNERIGFTWTGPDEPHGTQVDIFFAPKEEVPKAFAPEIDLTQVEVTEVTIRHSGIGGGMEWTERLSAYERGWKTGLENLKSVMETGIDKRRYDRPMLGIFPGELLDESRAAELGIPLTNGVILNGTIEGMGADDAGLQKDDIILSLNQHDLKDYPDFAIALAGCKAGDEVEVIFYRAEEKHEVKMKLSRRQLPDVPQSAAGLAQMVAKTYDEIAEEREVVFEGVSDSEASTRPGSSEWSAKETLVHLLHSERWLHLVISCADSEQRVGGYSNQLEMIAAMAGVYTLEELLTELTRSEQVTVASLRSLPDEFVADKRKFFGLAYGPGQGYAWHTRLHLDQIKAAIEHARSV